MIDAGFVRSLGFIATKASPSFELLHCLHNRSLMEEVALCLTIQIEYQRVHLLRVLRSTKLRTQLSSIEQGAKSNELYIELLTSKRFQFPFL